MGIALGRAGRISYEEMFRMADNALYKAKEDGKNNYHIDSVLDEPENGRAT